MEDICMLECLELMAAYNRNLIEQYFESLVTIQVLIFKGFNFNYCLGSYKSSQSNEYVYNKFIKIKIAYVILPLFGSTICNPFTKKSYPAYRTNFVRQLIFKIINL